MNMDGADVERLTPGEGEASNPGWNPDGQHLAFDAKQNHPLPNLFVSMLQRMGLETDKFASSTGTMRGLEAA